MFLRFIAVWKVILSLLLFHMPVCVCGGGREFNALVGGSMWKCENKDPGWDSWGHSPVYVDLQPGSLSVCVHFEYYYSTGVDPNLSSGLPSIPQFKGNQLSGAWQEASTLYICWGKREHEEPVWTLGNEGRMAHCCGQVLKVDLISRMLYLLQIDSLETSRCKRRATVVKHSC